MIAEQIGVTKTVLSNGLRVLTVPMPHTRAVSMGFYVGVGSRYEKEHEAGISHFIEHILFKGTTRRPTAADIANAVEGRGGYLNASTGQELTVYWAKVAYPHWQVAFDVLADMLLNATLAPEEIEKERNVIIEEINASLDIPEELVFQLINEMIWPGHPLGRDIAGTRESVGGLTRPMMADFLATNYHPVDTVLCLAGRIETDEVTKVADSFMGRWAPKTLPRYQPAPDHPLKPALGIIEKDTEQAQLCLSLPGLPRNHRRIDALRLLHTILGDGMSSRLFQEIRERQGLAYTVDTFSAALEDTGVSGVYAGVDTERVGPAILSIVREWRKLKTEPVSAEELNRVREYAKGRLLLGMEDTGSVAGWYGAKEALDNVIESPDEIVARLEAVKAEDIQEVAAELYDSQALKIALVGPFAERQQFDAVLDEAVKILNGE